MSELQDLYQETILDHYKRPRNNKKLENATATAEGFNPLCGDKLTLYLKISGDVVEEVTFEGSGCAISTASASLMTESLKGKTIAEVNRLFLKLHDVATSDPESPIDAPELGKLVVFAGVREFPTRVKCLTLAWHTMQAALENKDEVVSTE